MANQGLCIYGSTIFFDDSELKGNVRLCTDKRKLGIIELARIRTWNLLIRSQTRYPLRHKPFKSVCHYIMLDTFQFGRMVQEDSSGRPDTDIMSIGLN